MHNSDFRNTNMIWINGSAKHPNYYSVEAGAKIRVYCTVRKALPGGHEQGPGGCPWDEATQGRSVGWKRLCWLLDHNCRGESSTWIFPVVRQSSSMRWAQGGLRASALVSNSQKPWEADEVLSNPSAAAAPALRRPTGLSDRAVGCRDSETRPCLSHDSQPHRGQPTCQPDHANARCFPSSLHWNCCFHWSAGGGGVGLLLLLLQGKCPGFKG